MDDDIEPVEPVERFKYLGVALKWNSNGTEDAQEPFIENIKSEYTKLL